MANWPNPVWSSSIVQSNVKTRLAQVRNLDVPVLGQDVLVCPCPEQQFQQFRVAFLGGRVAGGPAGAWHFGIHLCPLLKQPPGKFYLKNLEISILLKDMRMSFCTC